MEALSATLVTIGNGIVAIAGDLASPFTIAVAALAASFAWMAVVDLEDLARQGNKPAAQRH